jgi:predicted ATPase/class 3 adenylate cyclase
MNARSVPPNPLAGQADEARDLQGLPRNAAVCAFDRGDGAIWRWETRGRRDGDGDIVTPRDSQRALPLVRIPDGIIGRSEVLTALERSLGSLHETGRRFVLLEGDSGVGKSTVLREMRRRVLASGGLVAAGEFGVSARRGPSGGLRSAIGDIAGTMLALPDDERHDWLFDLRQALGGPVEQFADLIPEFGKLAGRDVVPPAASPTGLRNRLRLAVLAVVRATARPTRPLMITLDDFDRADGESMQVVHDVVTGDAEGLLVLAAAKPGALRGQPVFDDPTAQRVLLQELDGDALERFVGAALGTAREPELGSIILQRVGSNPLAVIQFLQRAAAVGALMRSDPEGEWTWNEDTVRGLDPTPTQQEIASSVLAEFAGADILEVAACLGASFTIADLARAAGRSSDEVAETILDALDRRILRRGAATDPAAVFLDPNDSYAFVHERVADSVLSQVSLESQAEVHTRFGRALLRSEAPDDVIAAARHLNVGLHRLRSSTERMELASLNGRAARRARQSAAFSLEFELAEAGLACLPPGADDLDHPLVLDLHLLAAEAAWITGALLAMHALIDSARSLQTTVLDRAELAYLEMKGLGAEERQAEAVAVGRAALEELGVRFPTKPGTRHVVQALPGVRRRLRGKTDEELLSLPTATDPDTLAVQKLLSEMFGPAYMADPDLWPLLALKCLRFTLDGGRAPASPVAFAGYGLLLGITGRYDSARRFGDLALTMAEHPDCREFRPWTKFLFYDFIHHWTRPTADAIEPLREAIREALVMGDLESAGFMTAVELYQSFSYGVPLPEIDARGAELAVYLRPYETQFSLCEQTRQLVHSMMGRAPDPVVLVGETAYDERVMLPAAEARHDVTALSSYHLVKLGLHFMFGDFSGALHHANESEKCLDGIRGTPNVPIFHATNALVRLRAEPGRRSTRRALRRARRGFRSWRKHCPANYETPWLLMEAEAARASGDFRRAEELYDQTITAADRSGIAISAALAREYCGDLHAREGRDRVASAYLSAALEGWSALGADGKVEQLRRDYPGLLHPAARERTDPDARSLLELTNAIVGEFGFDEILEQLLATIVRVTDAQRGILFANDGATVVPSVVFEHGSTAPREVAGTAAYAASVVRYVERSDRPVLIPDTAASVHGRDQHLHAAGVRSVLCIPLTRGGVQRALVYLESADAQAFTPQHLETLRMLAAHVATALENAHLVRRLEEALKAETELVFAQSRFVPDQLLRELGRNTLVAIDAGDAVAREMTILYTDIRGYTHIQEDLDPRHGIGFLNDYLRRMEPPIVAHGGFVVSYVGDGMVALFEPVADGALKAALAMRRVEREVAEERRARGLEPVRTGIAVHTGNVVIGTFGGVNQLRCGVVGDAVNLASRIEGLTRDHAPLLISETAYERLADPSVYDLRRVGTFRVVGRTAPVTAWEAFDEDDPDTRSAKRSTLRVYEAALEAFEAGRVEDACLAFEQVARAVPGDSVARLYLTRCAALRDQGLPEHWDGIVTLDHK